MVRAEKSISVTPTITGRQLTSSDRLRLLPVAVVTGPAEDLPHLCSLTAGHWTLQKQRLWFVDVLLHQDCLPSFPHVHTQAHTCTHKHTHAHTRPHALGAFYSSLAFLAFCLGPLIFMNLKVETWKQLWLTLERHEFELHKSTYTQISVTKHLLQ